MSAAVNPSSSGVNCHSWRIELTTPIASALPLWIRGRSSDVSLRAMASALARKSFAFVPKSFSRLVSSFGAYSRNLPMALMSRSRSAILSKNFRSSIIASRTSTWRLKTRSDVPSLKSLPSIRSIMARSFEISFMPRVSPGRTSDAQPSLTCRCDLISAKSRSTLSMSAVASAAWRIIPSLSCETLDLSPLSVTVVEPQAVTTIETRTTRMRSTEARMALDIAVTIKKGVFGELP